MPTSYEERRSLDLTTMFIARNLLEAVAVVLDYLLWLYMCIIIARALIS